MRLQSRALAFSLIMLSAGCASLPREAKPTESSASKVEPVKKMVASFYGAELAGKKTASGEIFAPNALTAAHRSLPFGTRLRVTNSETGKKVEVRINDRGPFIAGRDLDLSKGAAAALGMKDDGVQTLFVEIL